MVVPDHFWLVFGLAELACLLPLVQLDDQIEETLDDEREGNGVRICSNNRVVLLQDRSQLVRCILRGFENLID